MPIVVPHSIADGILGVLPQGRAAAYRAALEANGTRTDAGWEFADNEALAKANDLFYPTGRPPMPAPPMPAKAVVEHPMLMQAKERSPICRACDRYGGDAGTLGVHCLCRGKANCRNVVQYSAACPEKKW